MSDDKTKIESVYINRVKNGYTVRLSTAEFAEDTYIFESLEDALACAKKGLGDPEAVVEQ